jgi:hypothetical protein
MIIRANKFSKPSHTLAVVREAARRHGQDLTLTEALNARRNRRALLVVTKLLKKFLPKFGHLLLLALL